MVDLKRIGHEFYKGLFRENVVLVSLIGLCSVLAVSSRFENGIYLGVAATFVLIFSELLVSAIRKLIPKEIRIPIFIVVIASFVTIVDLTMQAYSPSMYKVLGIWIPLIVVNCMILGRVEVFAYREPIIYSISDALGMGTGYTLALLIMGFVRELLGSGKVMAFGRTIISLPSAYEPASVFILFPGAFLTFAFLIAINRWLTSRGER
ncbi:MAG: electron transport complex subunit E [Actinobacteria bacterium]|nr:electron transport complex subunit E [Actinomycetota bacterium]